VNLRHTTDGIKDPGLSEQSIWEGNICEGRVRAVRIRGGDFLLSPGAGRGLMNPRVEGAALPLIDSSVIAANDVCRPPAIVESGARQ